MKSFVAACVVAIVLGLCAWVVLDRYQVQSSDAFVSGSSVRT